MILPISIATNGHMNTMGISPIAVASDGYINPVVVRRGISGNSESRGRGARLAAATRDDDDVLQILEQIFEEVA